MARSARFALPILLVCFVVFFSLLLPNTFATVGNLQTTVSVQSVLAVLALTALVPLVLGEFDLSIGAQLGLAALLVPGLTSKGMGLAPAIIMALVVTTVIGLVNGLLVARVRINSFITTIGMGALIQGIVLWFSGGTIIFENIPPSLQMLAQGKILGVPLPVVYLAIVAVLLWFVLEHTPFGRYLAAAGGSKEAARLSGLNVPQLTIIAFTLTGFLAGIAGVIQAAQLGTGNPAVGPPLLLPAFAAAYLGATSIRVGTFNVWGTVLAVITNAVGLTGLELLGVPDYVNPLFNGIALIIAVAATRYLHQSETL